MELSLFAKTLESELVRRGIPAEVAGRRVEEVARSFTEEDYAEIASVNSDEEVTKLADSLYAVLTRKPAAPTTVLPTPVPSPSPEKEAEETDRSAAPKPVELRETEDYDASLPERETQPSSRALAVFWCGLFLTLPLSLGLLALFLGVFGGMFLALFALIVACVAALIALAAAGALVSLVGIIYGVTQIFSGSVPAGVFEIGLGVAVAGGVVLVSVLLYNFALRFLPWVIRKAGVLFSFTWRKLKDLFRFVRKECYKL